MPPNERSASGADKQDWCTPPDLWAFGLEVFGVERFALDPAGGLGASVPAERVHIGARGVVHTHPEAELIGTPYMATDGLAVPWPAGVPIWFNPPWGKAIKGKSGGKTATHLWVEKLLQEAQRDARVCALLPCKVETEWWRELVEQADLLTVLPFRPRFVDPATGKPAGSGWSACALVLFSPNPFDAVRFRKACVARSWRYRPGDWR